MKLRSKLVLAITTAVLTVLALAPPGQAAGAHYQHLRPGDQPKLAERVPVNVVFVGYQPSQVALSSFRAGTHCASNCAPTRCIAVSPCHQSMPVPRESVTRVNP